MQLNWPPACSMPPSKTLDQPNLDVSFQDPKLQHRHNKVIYTHTPNLNTFRPMHNSGKVSIRIVVIPNCADKSKFQEAT